MVNAVLSHRVFGILSSLTYGAYLVHPIIIKVTAGNADDFYTYSPVEAIQRALFFSVLAYATSAVLWCLVERPFATIVDMALPKERSATKPDAPPSSAEA